MGVLGAVIGDLAASTFIENPEEFNTRLVGKDTRLSIHGENALHTILSARTSCAEEEVSSPFPFKKGDSREDCISGVFRVWEDRTSDSEKSVIRILTALVYDLLHGATKRECLQGAEGKQLAHILSTCDLSELPQEPSHILGIYLARAWKSFEEAWDFTSALHDALTHWSGDKHLTCTLTGALAGAMYGYGHCFSKDIMEPSVRIELPEHIRIRLADYLRFDWQNRHFFPKNNALTNVRKYSWTPYESEHEGKQISAQIAERIRLSFDPGWEDRYSFYYDNGWYYVCRSGFLMHRFRIENGTGFCYKMVDFQRSGDHDEHEQDIEVALDSVYNHWYYLDDSKD